MKAPGKLDDLTLVRAVLEIRYPKANKYWDASGQLMSQVEEGIPGLICESLDQNAGFLFRGSAATRLSTATFFWNRVSIEPELAAAAFDRLEGAAPTTQRFWEIVSGGLGITRVTRLGNRYWYLFPTPAAEELLAGARLWEGTDLLRAFGAPLADGIALRFAMADRPVRVRLEVHAGSIAPASKAKQDGVVLDVDFSMTNVDLADVDLAGFVRENQIMMRTHLYRLLR